MRLLELSYASFYPSIRVARLVFWLPDDIDTRVATYQALFNPTLIAAQAPNLLLSTRVIAVGHILPSRNLIDRA